MLGVVLFTVPLEMVTTAPPAGTARLKLPGWSRFVTGNRSSGPAIRPSAKTARSTISVTWLLGCGQ